MLRQIYWCITSKNQKIEDCGTDGQTDRINIGMFSERHFEWSMTCLPKLKISQRRGKQYYYTSRVTLGGGRHNQIQGYLNIETSLHSTRWDLSAGMSTDQINVATYASRMRPLRIVCCRKVETQ